MRRIRWWLFNRDTPWEWWDFRERWRARYGGYLPLPAEPFTKEQALAHLRVEHPCGCVEYWDHSPPSGMTCRAHALGSGPVQPLYFVYARTVLEQS